MMSANRKRLMGVAAVCCAAVVATVAGGWSMLAGSPENAKCPVSQREVDAGKGTVPHRGMQIGFCSEQCKAEFRTWSTPQRERVLGGMRMDSGGDGRDAEREGREPEPDRQDEKRTGDPYTLDTCPISGSKLGSMGDPPVRVYEGREVRFCCAGCIGRFENNLSERMEEINKKMIEDQRDLYAMEDCPVSGQELGSMGDPVEMVVGNRLVKLCCAGCDGAVKDEPETIIAKLDEAAKEAQREDYPMDVCPISGEELGSMGDPVELVLAGRLIKLCCAGCLGQVEAKPWEVLAKVDAAWDAASED